MDLKDTKNPSGPTQIGTITVEVDRDACIGASACIPLAEKTFTLDADGKAMILATADQDSEEAIVEAARACPVQAIKIKNAQDEQLAP